MKVKPSEITDLAEHHGHGLPIELMGQAHPRSVDQTTDTTAQAGDLAEINAQITAAMAESVRQLLEMIRTSRATIADGKVREGEFAFGVATRHGEIAHDHSDCRGATP